MKIRQNDWSEFGKGFIVKMRKIQSFYLVIMLTTYVNMRKSF